ncbi:hypothetical protein [Noviherbaspirillum cavernae]|uniref:hypothetical protein n=1 Tax=Noviherbaspirillum cavernae TaxID=2320862 RepID=UPI0018F6FAFE|nr:hypothetical protein [Noviherbaspirillum cavernae]
MTTDSACAGRDSLFVAVEIIMAAATMAAIFFCIEAVHCIDVAAICSISTHALLFVHIPISHRQFFYGNCDNLLHSSIIERAPHACMQSGSYKILR